MSNYKINRRTFISSTGIIFTLPLLESLFSNQALAQAASDPKRYVAIYFPNGTYNRADKPIWWTPTGALNAGNASLALAPFATNLADMVNVNQMRNAAYWKQAEVFGDDHQNAATSFLTCADRITATTTSFEHVLGAAFNKPALVLSGGTTGYDQPFDRFISYKNGVGDPGISNPGDVYRMLMSKIVPGGPAPTGAQSVIDSALADLTAFNSKLGKADKAKMDEYLTALRALETKIARAPSGGGGTGPSCTQPTLAPGMDNTDSRNTELYLPKMYAMNDMIRTAFACDITRSVSIMLDTETTGRTFAKAPANLQYLNGDISGGFLSHEPISHASGLSSDGYNRCVTRDRVLMTIVVDLINKLKASTDASGSRILDNTVIESGFGVQDGNHGEFQDKWPIVLSGGRNLFSQGKTVLWNTIDKRDFYYTIARAMGANIPSFQGSTRTITLP